MGRSIFKRIYRLTRDYEHKKVWRFGSRLFSELFDLRFLRTNEAHPRLAFVASKKLGKANERHRTLRLLREAVRMSMEKIKPGWWLVFYARKSLKGLKLADILPSVESVLGKIR